MIADAKDVSIHAPTRGATGFRAKGYFNRWSFNPRTHTGCDDIVPLQARPQDGFNPRTHTGCDALIREFRDCTLFVSIHAPTRGATNFGVYKFMGKVVSIHAPTRGATGSAAATWCVCLCFNPRTHTGCDIVIYFLISKQGVSIHAPTRGATYLPLRYIRCSNVSIHAPTRGATVYLET